MDGPQEGPAAAFEQLATLNPLNTAALAVPRPARVVIGSSTNENGFVLLRPAAIKGALVSEICQRFTSAGLTLSAMKMIKPGAELAKKHYSEPKLSTSKLADLVGDLGPGPVVAMLWCGAGAISTLLGIAGAADPQKALPGSVRGDLSAADCPDPLLEVAPDAAQVRRLTDVWFDEDDLDATAPSFADAKVGSRRGV